MLYHRVIDTNYLFRTKIVDPGFLKAKFVVYVIETQPQGIRVERRYNEFETFRSEFIRLHPGCMVSPIPKKKAGKKLDPVFINKRKRLLQSFLNSILKHPLLRCSELLMQFLTFGQKEWDAKAKLVAKIPGPKEASECKTSEGQARVEVSPEAESFCTELLNGLGVMKDEHNE